MKKFLRYFVFTLSFIFSTQQLATAQCNSPHFTQMLANNGQNGIMFDITAITDVTIDSVWSNWDPGTLPSVEIWFKTGTCVGSQATPGAWTLIGSVNNLLSAGNNNFTQIPIYINQFVAAGQTVALYVTKGTTTGAVNANYTTGPVGSTAGQLYNQNANIQVSYAYGKSYPFAATFNPRIWNGRIFYSCCPTPPPIQGPINGSTSVCIGDTVTYWVPQDSLAVSYEWAIPATDTIVSGENDSLMQIVIGPNSTGGQICVNYLDSCSNSNDTCISYTINQPSAPTQPTGPIIICNGDSAFYSIPAVAGAISYNWIATNGAVVLSNPDSTSAQIKFLSPGTTNVCVQLTDNCATSDTVCMAVNVGTGTTPSNAGFDIYKCDNEIPVLGANSPANGVGSWSVISGPSGGGTLSDPIDNTAIYSNAAPGVHTLAWTITNGSCPTYVDMVDVHIAGTPIANFSVDNACVGTPINFIDQTTANGTSLSSWAWDLTGNGNANTLNQNATFTYNTAGPKQATLIVTSLGCSDTAVVPFEVYPLPQINILGLNACDKDAVAFNNNSTILYGSIDSLSWNFGDGTQDVTPSSTSHVFSQPGQYTTTVTAYSNQGCQSISVENVEVYHNPSAQFVYQNACQFQELSFTNQSSVSNANITNYTWNLGDGSSSSIKNPINTYNVNGIQNVNLFVTTNQGCVDDTTVAIEVFPTPVSEFNYSNSICEGQTTMFQEVTNISYGSIAQFEWTLFDSFNFAGPTLNYSFPGVGAYNVKLKSISNHGCEHEIEKMVPVFAMPTADFAISGACEGLPVVISNLSASADPIGTYTWNFNDGSTLNQEFNPVHSFDTFGVFDVVLTTETFKGCKDEIMKSIEIFEQPNPNFALPIDSGCSPLTVSFIDSTVMLSGDYFSYKWRVDDGAFLEEESTNIYNYSGKEQALQLEAIYTSSSGCETIVLEDSLLLISPQPKADFSYLPTTITTLDPLVQFQDQSRDANYWGWIFGDGTADRERNPYKLYENAGEYIVQLWTRNIFGCVDTATATLIVEPGNRLFVPSSFSPNQDGLNDVFEIYGLETATVSSLKIYDRWGSIIWDGDILKRGWDGIGKNGKLVNNGAYPIYLKYEIEGKVNEFTGTVTVIGVEQ
jgi:gliding motility-associated-like protein